MTPMMRTLPATALALMLAVPALAGDQGPPRQRPRDDERRGPEATERFSRTLRLGRGGTFDLSNVAGDIVITGGGGNELRVDAVKRVRSRDEADAKAQLEAIQIEIVELSNRVEVRTIYPGLQRRNAIGVVDYTVALPQDAQVTVKSVAGDIRVTNVRGELRAESVNGHVTASDAPRVSALKSVSGNVQLTNGAAETSLDVNTVSGDVIIRGLKARTFDAGTVSGNLRLEEIESERVNLKSVSGDLWYGGALARGGRYEFAAHSGNVLLNLSGDTGFDVEATTFSGDVRSDYALTLRGNDDNVVPPPLGRGRRGRIGGLGRPAGPGRQNRGVRTLRGSFGDGRASVELQTFSGDIAITRE